MNYRLNLDYDPAPSDGGMTLPGILLSIVVNNGNQNMPEAELRVRAVIIGKIEAAQNQKELTVTDEEYQILQAIRSRTEFSEARMVYVAALDAIDTAEARQPNRKAKRAA